MIANIQNQNFGYSVAVDSIWAAVGNPSLLRYNPLTSSLIRTGSIEVFKYNINTDTHNKKMNLYRRIDNTEVIFLTTEYNTSSILITSDSILHTEYTGTIPITSDLDIIVDEGSYFTASEDGYGYSVDIKGDILVVGCPYFRSTFSSSITQSHTFYGSGSVDVFDLSKLNIDPYAVRIPPEIVNHYFGPGGTDFDLIGVSVPAGQNYRYVFLQTKESTDPESYFQTICVGNTSNLGGLVFLQTHYYSVDEIGIDFRVLGIVGTDPYLTTIYNPNSSVSESFGYSVSLNDKWLVIGSPLESGSKGSIFLFRNEGMPDSWSLYQNITPPNEINSGDQFGHSVALNKQSGSYSGSLVVGTLKPNNSRVYEYNFDGINWNKRFTLIPDNATQYPLTFYPTIPLFSGSFPNTADSFGFDVDIFEDTIIVGAPTDRAIYEYSGSQLYKQGAVYFFERCPNPDIGYYIARKSYGNKNIIKNNLLGWSVGIFGQYVAVGIPKINAESSSICYLQGSLFQNNYCGDSIEETLDGQYALYNKTIGTIPDTSFIDWNLLNIYQIRKKYLSPYRTFGWAVDISDQFIIVGSPMLIWGPTTDMSFNKDIPFGSIVLSLASGSAILNWVYTNTEQDGFNIEKSTDGIIYNNIYILSSSISRSYTDINVSVNNTYWYRVNAFNDLGVSEYSNTASIFFPPPPPSGPIVLSVQSGSSTGPSVLSWTFTDSFQDGFNIEKSIDGIAFNNINILAVPAARTDNDAAVSVDNTYWYRVNAYNIYGTSSYSNTASIYYLIPIPSGPTVLTVTTGSTYLQSIGTGSSILSWSYTNTTETGWNIEKSSSAAPGFININTLVIPSLRAYEDSASIDANSTYWYKVQPYNGYGTGSYSNNDSASFSNILYFSGSSKYYVNPTGYINESAGGWKGCFGYKNINLTNLDVSNNSLTTLNLVSASSLTVLTCSYNNLTSLDVRSNPSIAFLFCNNNLLTDLKVNSGSSLAYLYCNTNQLTSLDVTKNPTIDRLNCSVNNLTSLDVTKNTLMTELRCFNNSLTALDLSKNTIMSFVDAAFNNITSLDMNLSGCSVNQLYISNNQLSGLNDFDNCTNLSWLNIQSNNYPTISVGRWSASLDVLGIDDNPLGGVFDATAFPSMSTFYCNNNDITNLDFSNCKKLSQVICYANSFSTLDLNPSSGSLEVLNCSINQYLTSLDVSKCYKLIDLSCNESGLTSLSISGSSLTSVDANDNNLSTVDVGSCPNLITLDAARNSIPSGSINQILIDLDSFGSLSGTVDVSGSNEAPTGLGITARTSLVGKGWTVNDSSGTYP